MDSLDVWPLSVENEALLTCNFTSVVSIFFKTCVKDHGDSSSRLRRKKGLISMYRCVFVNILFFFNKLANIFQK